MHAQSRRFAGLGRRREGFHAVSPHKNSAVADIEKYTKGRDVVNHADDCNQILEIPVSHSFRSVPSLGNANRKVFIRRRRRI